jgi:hypothetical protein
VLIDQVLRDPHGVAAATEGELDQLVVRLAGTGGRRPARGRQPRRQPGGRQQTHAEVVDTSLAGFARSVDPAMTGFGGRRRRRGAQNRDAGGLEIGAGRGATSLTGFQLSTTGRFWVSTEEQGRNGSGALTAWAQRPSANEGRGPSDRKFDERNGAKAVARIVPVVLLRSPGIER